MTAEVLIQDQEKRLRRLRAEDEKRLLDWRNQAHIRAASFDQDPIDAATHAAWFAKARARPDAMYAVFEDQGRPLGHVALTPGDEGFWRWSFYIGEPDAPRGSGRAMLGLALTLLLAREDCRGVVAETLPGNRASERLHEALGFLRQETAAQTSRRPHLLWRLNF